MGFLGAILLPLHSHQGNWQHRSHGISNCSATAGTKEFTCDVRNKGKDIGTITKLLGHANPTITQNIYVHWWDERIHQAAIDLQICGQMLQKGAKSPK